MASSELTVTTTAAAIYTPAQARHWALIQNKGSGNVSLRFDGISTLASGEGLVLEPMDAVMLDGANLLSAVYAVAAGNQPVNVQWA